MSRRVRSVAALAAVVVVGLLGSGASGAAAAPPVVAVGWWTSNPAATAPEGGVAVGWGAGSATTVAAVRVDLGGGARRLVLELPEDSVVGAVSGVAVCVTADTWAPAAGGPLEDAPATECPSDAAVLRADGGTWTADVTGLVAGRTGTVSFAVVPDGGTLPWEVRFGEPAARLTPVPPATTTTTTSPTTTTTAAPAVVSPPPAAPPPPRTPLTSAPTTAPPPTTTTTTVALADRDMTPQVSEQVALAATDEPGRDRATAGQAVTYALIGILVGAAVGLGHWLVTNGRLPSVRLPSLRPGR